MQISHNQFLVRFTASLTALLAVVGCPGFGTREVASTVDIPENPTWCNSMEELITVKCNECHGETLILGTPEPYHFNSYELAEGFSGRILVRSEDRTMPPANSANGPLSDEELAGLRRWVDAGAPFGDCGADADSEVDAGDDAEETIDDTTLDGDDVETVDIPAEVPTLRQVYDEVFVAKCAPCHTDRADGELFLPDGPELPGILLSESVQAPGVMQIVPGDPDNSYFYAKCADTHEALGGSGVRMPVGPRLARAKLDLLRAWIVGGAPMDGFERR